VPACPPLEDPTQAGLATLNLRFNFVEPTVSARQHLNVSLRVIFRRKIVSRSIILGIVLDTLLRSTRTDSNLTCHPKLSLPYSRTISGVSRAYPRSISGWYVSSFSWFYPPLNPLQGGETLLFPSLEGLLACWQGRGGFLFLVKYLAFS
jgi:hypothetical protein